jgi:predicted porin
MFERQPDASAPIRQSRFAPAPERGLPLTVGFFLTAEEEFTDNANQSKDNRISQFSTRIAPGVSIGADRPWANFGLSYAPQFFIEDNSIRNTEFNQTLSARVALWPAGRFQVNIAENFTDSNDFRDQQDPGSRLTGTGNYIENVVTAEAAYVLPKLRAAVGYTNVINQTDVGFTDTRIDHTGRLSAAYTDPRFNLTGSYSLTRGNENSSLEIPYWTQRGDARFGYVFTPAISAILFGSYEYQEPDTGEPFATGIGRVGGTFAIGPDGTLELQGGFSTFMTQGEETKLRPSFLLAYTQRLASVVVRADFLSGFENRSDALDATGVTFTRSAGLFVTTSELLFRQLTGTAGIRWTQEEFQQTSTFGGPPGTKDQTWDFDVSISYPLARSLSLGLGYTGTIRTSDQSSAGYYENRVRLGLRYTYTLF